MVEVLATSQVMRSFTVGGDEEQASLYSNALTLGCDNNPRPFQKPVMIYCRGELIITSTRRLSTKTIRKSVKGFLEVQVMNEEVSVEGGIVHVDPAYSGCSSLPFISIFRPES